jgi:hypothetical protein
MGSIESEASHRVFGPSNCDVFTVFNGIEQFRELRLGTINIDHL